MSEVRHGKALIDASRPFAVESRAKSWWYVVSTLAVIAALVAVAAAAPAAWWPLRLAASVLGGLVIVRGFILYHDFWHGSILKGSALAYYITLHDLNYWTDQLRRATSDIFFSYTVGLLVYFAIAYLLTWGMNWLEERAKRRLGRGTKRPSVREALRVKPDVRPEAIAGKGVAA